jgi:hypothetical protein
LWREAVIEATAAHDPLRTFTIESSAGELPRQFSVSFAARNPLIFSVTALCEVLIFAQKRSVETALDF